MLRKLGLGDLFDLKTGIERQALHVTEARFSDFKAYCGAHNIRCAALLLPTYYGRDTSGSDFDSLIRKFESIGLEYMDLRHDFRSQSNYQYANEYLVVSQHTLNKDISYDLLA
jgi:hypothetical protein